MPHASPLRNPSTSRPTNPRIIINPIPDVALSTPKVLNLGPHKVTINGFLNSDQASHISVSAFPNTVPGQTLKGFKVTSLRIYRAGTFAPIVTVKNPKVSLQGFLSREGQMVWFKLPPNSVLKPITIYTLVADVEANGKRGTVASEHTLVSSDLFNG
jgi:hypothetical protein